METLQTVSFSDQNEIIFSDEQKEFIINKFPIQIQNLLRSVKNPLDEREVIINMFKDKKVRIIIKYEKDILDDYYENKGSNHNHQIYLFHI